MLKGRAKETIVRQQPGLTTVRALAAIHCTHVCRVRTQVPERAAPSTILAAHHGGALPLVMGVVAVFGVGESVYG